MRRGVAVMLHPDPSVNWLLATLVEAMPQFRLSLNLGLPVAPLIGKRARELSDHAMTFVSSRQLDRILWSTKKYLAQGR